MPEKILYRYEIRSLLSALPVYQFAFLLPKDIHYSRKVREFCYRKCRHYKTSWSCPPAVGRIAECRDRCMQYDAAVFFSTIETIGKISMHDKRDRFGDEHGMHEKLTAFVDRKLSDIGLETHILTSDVCALCEKCAYPKGSCRHPGEMHPCVESHGILISELAGQNNMDYYLDEAHRLLFTVIFYRRKASPQPGA